MLVEIIKILENIVVGILIILPLVWTIFLYAKELSKTISLTKTLKAFICIFLTLSITVCSMIISGFSIYNIGMLWDEAEAQAPSYIVEPWIEEMSYLASEVFVFSINVALIFLLWHFFYSRQIIPGEGTAKERIKKWFDFKVKK